MELTWNVYERYESSWATAFPFVLMTPQERFFRFLREVAAESTWLQTPVSQTKVTAAIADHRQQSLEVDVIEVSDVVLHMAETYFDFHSCCANSGRCEKSQEEMLACRERPVDEIISLQPLLLKFEPTFSQHVTKCVYTTGFETWHKFGPRWVALWNSRIQNQASDSCHVEACVDEDMVTLLWVKQGRFSLVTADVSWSQPFVWFIFVSCVFWITSHQSAVKLQVLRIWCCHQRCVTWSNGVNRYIILYNHTHHIYIYISIHIYIYDSMMTFVLSKAA